MRALLRLLLLWALLVAAIALSIAFGAMLRAPGGCERRAIGNSRATVILLAANFV